MTKVPTAPTTTTSENSASFKMTFRVSTYENLPHFMDANSPFINATSVISSESHNVNVPTVIYSSSNNGCSYSISDTLVPTLSTFIFPSSEQIVCDIISFVIQAPPLSTCTSLQLFVLENMLHKHFKPSLVSHIDSMLYANPNRNYISFDSIVCSCITQLIGTN